MGVEHGGHGLAVGDVEPRGAGVGAGGAQPFGLTLGPVGVDVGQGDPSAGLGQHLGIGQADPRRGAGDQARPAADIELGEGGTAHPAR